MAYDAYGYYRPEPDDEDEHLIDWLENQNTYDRIDASPYLFDDEDDYDNLFDHLKNQYPYSQYFIVNTIRQYINKGMVTDECPRWLRDDLRNAVEDIIDENMEEIDAYLIENYYERGVKYD